MAFRKDKDITYKTIYGLSKKRKKPYMGFDLWQLVSLADMRSLFLIFSGLAESAFLRLVGQVGPNKIRPVHLA
jgi:hypothetical protein